MAEETKRPEIIEPAERMDRMVNRVTRQIDMLAMQEAQKSGNREIESEKLADISETLESIKSFQRVLAKVTGRLLEEHQKLVTAIVLATDACNRMGELLEIITECTTGEKGSGGGKAA